MRNNYISVDDEQTKRLKEICLSSCAYSCIGEIYKLLNCEILQKLINKIPKQTIKLKSDLFNLGYDKYMIDNILSNIKYESNALEKDFNSALKKYKDDKNKLINYLLRKGYSYDEINTKLKNLV